jgi:UDP-N-acetylmuramate--alanine ligase
MNHLKRFKRDLSMNHQSDKYHFIGVGGIGMSALANILLDKGAKVTGSDQKENYQTLFLKNKGASISIGHKAGELDSSVKVVFSSAIKSDNPEWLEAKQKGCSLLHRSELLAQLTEGFRVLAVAGSHGKTTTTSLLSSVLLESDYKPSYAIGGVLLENGLNGGYGVGEFFVAESDESDGSFLRVKPNGAIVTNIAAEHLDHYGSFENLKECFLRFISSTQVPDLLFWCIDDPVLAELKPKGVSYGQHKDAQLQLSNYEVLGWSSSFDLTWKGKVYPQIEIKLTGLHNALNAAAVFGMALSIEITEEVIRRCLQNFKGIKRRCEQKGEHEGILIIDDYGHHPDEVKATLKAVKNSIKGKQLIVAFQPHRYTRFNACFKEFIEAFDDANQAWIIDTYTAGEKAELEKVTPQQLVDTINLKSQTKAIYCPKNELVSRLGTCIKGECVIITMGAGDITEYGEKILDFLKKRI